MNRRTVIRRLLPCIFAAALGCASGAAPRRNDAPRPASGAPGLAAEIRRSLRVEEFGAWYPRPIDREQGGFYWLVTRDGRVRPEPDGRAIKQAYGNAFGIYALAAYYDVSRYTAAL